MLRLAGDELSMAKRLRQAADEYTLPPASTSGIVAVRRSLWPHDYGPAMTRVRPLAAINDLQYFTF